jgi:hypothetical protein
LAGTVGTTANRLEGPHNVNIHRGEKEEEERIPEIAHNESLNLFSHLGMSKQKRKLLVDPILNWMPI